MTPTNCTRARIGTRTRDLMAPQSGLPGERPMRRRSVFRRFVRILGIVVGRQQITAIRIRLRPSSGLSCLSLYFLCMHAPDPSRSPDALETKIRIDGFSGAGLKSEPERAFRGTGKRSGRLTDRLNASRRATSRLYGPHIPVLRTRRCDETIDLSDIEDGAIGVLRGRLRGLSPEMVTLRDCPRRHNATGRRYIISMNSDCVAGRIILRAIA